MATMEHVCSACGEAVAEACAKHPRATVDSVMVPGSWVVTARARRVSATALPKVRGALAAAAPAPSRPGHVHAAVAELVELYGVNDVLEALFGALEIGTDHANDLATTGTRSQRLMRRDVVQSYDRARNHMKAVISEMRESDGGEIFASGLEMLADGEAEEAAS